MFFNIEIEPILTSKTHPPSKPPSLACADGSGKTHQSTQQYEQDGLETITTKNVIIEANAHNTPAVLHSAGEEESLYILMPMHIDGK